MIDFTLLGFMTLALYYDSYVLDSWRLDDQEKRLKFAYDNDIVFYLP